MKNANGHELKFGIPEQTRKWTVKGTRLEEFEKVCASIGLKPGEVVNEIINEWLSLK